MFKDIGNYQQGVWFDVDGVIVDMQCTCMHGTIHRIAWEENEGICKHLKKAIKELKNDGKNK